MMFSQIVRRFRTSRVLLRRGSARHVGLLAVALLGAGLTQHTFNQSVQLPRMTVQHESVQVVAKEMDACSDIIPCAIQVVNDAVSWLLGCLLTLMRCGSLCMIFTPAVTALPVALATSNDTVWDWWWCMFRSSICSAGPTFIKFAQVTE
jgi:hypothetical protein